VFGTRVSCAKTAKPIEMPFGGLTHKDPRNHVLDKGPGPSREGALLNGHVPVVESTGICGVYELCEKG